MIKKALDDNDHLVKLHKRVCEEWSSLLNKNPQKPPVEAPQSKNKSPMTVNARKKIEKPELKNETSSSSSKTSRKIIQRDHENRQKVHKLTRPKQEDGTKKKIKEEEENARWRRERAWEFYHQQKRVQKGWKMRKNWELNSWLNQLDSVLHQKYLREHRHQVQSFYCQPTYYGTDIPDALHQQCMQYRFINSSH
ncbi:uncharacterized protein LOC107036902 [Diachasma alloeum]|uniref:uncharacterized protein LOC107036902 n=1 Tax=Diachasma alloeum TaxID=454923 RepID=UPI0007384EC5|nr:uncharacterized protein LOC107036902 [Diachasma alloeum]